MTLPGNLRNIGDQVLVYDDNGNFECRGVIVGRTVCEHPVYDVQFGREFSLSGRIRGVPESRLRSVGRPFHAYERRLVAEPRHFKEDA